MSDVDGVDFNFQIASHKYWLAKGPKSVDWVNTYEFNFPGSNAVDTPGIRELCDDIKSFERLIHNPRVFIEKLNVRTWKEDSHPYNANEGRPIYYAQYGLREWGPDGGLDLESTYDVMRECNTGNPGRLKFRGVLGKEDVEANEVGAYRLKPDSGLQNGQEEWAAAAIYLTQWCKGGEKSDLWGITLAMFGANDLGSGVPDTARLINTFVPVGVGRNPLNHKYYNKQPIVRP